MQVRHLLFVGAALAAGFQVLGAERGQSLPAWAAPEQEPAAVASEKVVRGPVSSPLVRRDVKGADEAIDFSADDFSYSADQSLIIARGNVVVTQGAERATADYMTLNRSSGEIYARGNVTYSSGGTIWKGEQLTYNFKTKVGRPGGFTAYFPPFYITANDSVKTSPKVTKLTGVTVTTCEGPEPEAAMKFAEATLSENEEGEREISGSDVSVEWNGVPVMWFPKFSRTLGGHDSWFEYLPGYSSRRGAFLLTAFNLKLGTELLATTHVDPMSKRGIGIGQDFAWDDESVDANGRKNFAWEGGFKAYWLKDNEPFKNEDEERDYGDVQDDQRYRLKLSHRHNFTPRDYFIGGANYLSDPNILDDFFNDEYRRGVQPENRATYTHRGDNYTLAVEVNKRLNDFYENVERTPEVRLDINRTELGDSGLYYESQNSFGHLERAYAEGDTNYLLRLGISGVQTNYDAFRFDTGHRFFYPTRHFGWLNLTPRAGYQGTYYSTTYDHKKEFVTVISTNAPVTITTNSFDRYFEEGSGVRNLFELGLEASFKAFKTWDNLVVLDGGDGLRHVAEPYIDYSFIPEPNLTREDLPQFDRIDRLGERHDIQIGMRNKLQTRHNKSIWDIVDADVWTYYRVEKVNEEDEDFDFIYSHTELKLLRNLPVDFDFAYDPYEGNFEQFATQIAYLDNEDRSRYGLEYRFRDDGEDFITPFILWRPRGQFGFEAFWRHDFDTQELEEQSYFVHWDSTCLGYGLGFRETDGDYQFWVTASLLAMPQTHLNLGR